MPRRKKQPEPASDEQPNIHPPVDDTVPYPQDDEVRDGLLDEYVIRSEPPEQPTHKGPTILDIDNDVEEEEPPPLTEEEAREKLMRDRLAVSNAIDEVEVLFLNARKYDPSVRTAIQSIRTLIERNYV